MFVRSWSRLLRTGLKADASLARLPSGVRQCDVYRNAITMREQEQIHQEWLRVLEKEGEKQELASSTENKVLKNTFVDIFGDKNFTEVKSNHKREIRRLPGLVWSPTMMKVLDDLCPLLWSCPSGAPNMGRVVEHSLPGYEMHTEHPTVGSSFLYLNLLSDTVLVFDDESTTRSGSVLLPAGSVMRVSGEARWGFRFGEESEDEHEFIFENGVKRSIATDLRLSIQLWRFHPGLLDCFLLQERMQESLHFAKQRLEGGEPIESSKNEGSTSTALPNANSEKKKDVEEAIEALKQLKETDFSNVLKGSSSGTPSQPEITSTDVEPSLGSGLLGGDFREVRSDAPSLKADRLLHNLKGDFSKHKTQFAKIHGVLEEMKLLQSKGEPIDDMWMKRKITENNTIDAERDAREGYNPDDVEGSWDKVDGKAKFYKRKLKTMDYDGTAFVHSRMPDVSQDAPLDMKATIAKLAPHVRDGDKILQNLPQSP